MATVRARTVWPPGSRALCEYLIFQSGQEAADSVSTHTRRGLDAELFKRVINAPSEDSPPSVEARPGWDRAPGVSAREDDQRSGQ